MECSAKLASKSVSVNGGMFSEVGVLESVDGSLLPTGLLFRDGGSVTMTVLSESSQPFLLPVATLGDSRGGVRRRPSKAPVFGSLPTVEKGPPTFL